MAGGSDDTWEANVVKLLLTEFDGRAKLSDLITSICQRKLMTDCAVNSIRKKLKSSKRFLVFEKNGDIKYVSVYCKGATVCSHPRRWKSEMCMRDSCSQFHVCKSFISGHCVFGAKCLFGHTLQSEANKRASDKLGLSFFSAGQIRMIIFRSHPAVCVKYNTEGCDDVDCPDLHVCSRFILKNCTAGAKCKMGHSFGKSEHNKWILGTFLLSHWSNNELMKRILVKQLTQCATSDYTDLLEEEEETEDYISKVFSFLIKRFGGRTKFNTFLCERGYLLQRFSRTEIIEWFEDYSDRFLLYENEGDVKYVSVYNPHARVCFTYNNLGDSKCDVQPCKSFHICKDFVAGCCVSKECNLSHNCLSSWPYAEICSDLNHKFSNSEMCTIIVSSNPAVCLKHNASGCHLNDCPDLHICSKNILNQCTSGEGCKFGHSIRNSGEHNSYVLKAFRMEKWREDPLRRLVIVERKDHRDTGTTGAGTTPVQATPAESQKKVVKETPAGGEKEVVIVSPSRCRTNDKSSLCSQKIVRGQREEIISSAAAGEQSKGANVLPAKSASAISNTQASNVSALLNLATKSQIGDTSALFARKAPVSGQTPSQNISPSENSPDESHTKSSSISNSVKEHGELKTKVTSISTPDTMPTGCHKGLASPSPKQKTTSGGKIGGGSSSTVLKVSSKDQTGVEKKKTPGIQTRVPTISATVGEAIVATVKNSPAGGHTKNASTSFSEKDRAVLKTKVTSISTPDRMPPECHIGAASATTKKKMACGGKTGGASISPVHKATFQGQIKTEEKSPAGVQKGVTGDVTVSLVKKAPVGGQKVLPTVVLQKSSAGDVSALPVKKAPAEGQTGGARVSGLKKEPEARKPMAASVSTAEKTPTGHHKGSVCASPDQKECQKEGASISPVYKASSQGQTGAEKKSPTGVQLGVDTVSTAVNETGDTTIPLAKKSPAESASVTTKQKTTAGGKTGGASISPVHKTTSLGQIGTGKKSPVKVQTGVASVSTAVGDTHNATVSLVKKESSGGQTGIPTVSLQESPAGGETGDTSVSPVKKAPAEGHTGIARVSSSEKKPDACKTDVAGVSTAEKMPAGYHTGSVCASLDQKDPSRSQTEGASISPVHKEPSKGQTGAENETSLMTKLEVSTISTAVGKRVEATVSAVKESPTGGHAKSASILSSGKGRGGLAGAAGVASTQRMAAEGQTRGVSVTPVLTISTVVGEAGNTAVSIVKKVSGGHTKSSSISYPEKERADRKTEFATISALQKMSGEHHTEGSGTSPEQKTTAKCKLGGESISPVHKASQGRTEARNKSLDGVHSGVVSVGTTGDALLSSLHKESNRSLKSGSIVSYSDSLPVQKTLARCQTSDVSISPLQKDPDGSQTEGVNEVLAGGQLRIVKDTPSGQTGESCVLSESKESVGVQTTGTSISPVVITSAEGLTGVANITRSDEELAANQTEVASILTAQKMRTTGTVSVTPVQNVPLIGKTQVAMITPAQIVLNGGQTLDGNISSSKTAPSDRQTGAEKKSPTGAQTGVATVSTAIDQAGDATISTIKKSPAEGHTKSASTSDSEKKRAGLETGVSSDSTAEITPAGRHTGATSATPKKKTTAGGKTGGASISHVHKATSQGQTETEEKAPAGVQIKDSTVSTAVGNTRDVTVSPVKEAPVGVQTGLVKEASAWRASESPVPKELAESRTAVATVPPSSAESHRGAVTTTPVQDTVEDANPYNYEYICETHTWTGVCPNAQNCPHYHSPDRLPYLWLFHDENNDKWRSVSSSVWLEKRFCGMYDVRKIQFAGDFTAMTFRVENMTSNRLVKLRRLSTPSYVTAAPGTPLNFYTQWVWCRQKRDGTYTPFIPGSLQYTLEEKYLKGEHQYYFEFEELRLMVDSSLMIQTNLDTHGSTKILRRPVFVSTKTSQAPTMSPLLLSDAPKPIHHVTGFANVSPLMETPAERRTEFVSVPPRQEAPEEGQKGYGIVSPAQEAFTGGQEGVATVLPVPKVPTKSAKSQKGVAALPHVEETFADGHKVLAITSPVEETGRSQMKVATVTPAEGHRGVSNFSPLQKEPAGGPREVVNASVVQNNVQDVDPSKYEYICETYTWRGACPNSPNCPRYHSPDRLPYLWLIYDEKDRKWRIDSSSFSLEKRFCQKLPEPFIFERIGRILVKRRRLSTPSYVTAAPGTPLNFYTQWVWYRRERDDTYIPFIPGTLQYTLEEKYLKGQHKYYFEFEDLRLMVDTRGSSMRQTNLDTQRFTNVLRRPVFVSTKSSHTPTMSALLLSDAPNSFPEVPKHWTAVDHFQDFELVELNSDDPKYDTVQRQFFSTMDIHEHKIQHIFRVQNPGLWHKYCCERRFMTPRGKTVEDVEERQLFHGTPTLQAARGICTNSFDFRRSGENAGTVWGKGAYFSTTARYSHSYTRADTPASGAPRRFMFLGKVLVGQYTLGHPSYTKPPERDRLKLYDSCVNNKLDPTIFVIFDLAKSYPEYLLQYTDYFKHVDAVSRIQSPFVTTATATANAYPLSGYNMTASPQGVTHQSSSSKNYCIIS